MSLLQPFDREDSERSASTEPYVPFRRQRPSGRIGFGSLRCPDCEVPISLGAPVILSERMRCPYCRAIHDVRGYVRLGEPDTTLNAVELRARLPH